MKILAVDLGDARTGLAVCDPSELLASPLEVISEWNPDRLLEKIQEQVERQGAQQVVVGNPINLDGSVGSRAEKCQALAQRLCDLLSVPVRLWDERSTTVSAIGYLNQTDVRGKKRKAVVDAVAAVIILENYLAYRRNHPQEEGGFLTKSDAGSSPQSPQ